MTEHLAGYDQWKTTRPTDRNAERLADLEADLGTLLEAAALTCGWPVPRVFLDADCWDIPEDCASARDAAALVADRLQALACAIEQRRKAT